MIQLPLFSILIIFGLIIIISDNLNLNKLISAIGALMMFPIAVVSYSANFEIISFKLLLQVIEEKDLIVIFVGTFSLAISLVILYGLISRTINFKETGLAFIYSALSIGIFSNNSFNITLILMETTPIIATLMIAINKKHNMQRIVMQYLIIHIISSLILTIGIDSYVYIYGSSEINNISNITNFSKYFILTGLLINLAIFPLSFWFIDSISHSSNQVSMLLSIFSTRIALFVLVKTFIGYHYLLYFGIIMLAYGWIFSLFTPNIKKILAYSIIQRIGFFLVVLSFNDINIFKANIFMFSTILCELAFFIIAGILNKNLGTDNIYKMQGCFYKKHIVGITLIILSLNLMVFPLTGVEVGNANLYNSLLYLYDNQIYYIIIVCTAFSASVVGLKIPYLLYIKSPVINNKEYVEKINFKEISNVLIPIFTIMFLFQFLYIIYYFVFYKFDILMNIYSSLKIMLVAIVLFIILIMPINIKKELSLYTANERISNKSYICIQFITSRLINYYLQVLQILQEIIMLLYKKIYLLQKFYYNNRIIYIIAFSIIVISLTMIFGIILK